MINQIRKPIAAELDEFESFFRANLKSPNRILSVITNYVLRTNGKKMRPMLVFLAAMQSGKISSATNVAATLIELLHTATLVQDDVVDETFQRRGKLSVNAIWNHKVAVLVGDFFLARGLQIAMENSQIDILRVVSDAVQEISEGELQQIEHARHLDITEDTYYQVIRKKTATLIAACTKCGAISSGAAPEVVEAMYAYGLYLGIAFQIKDDIFDYTPSSALLLGKPTGNDIKERKLTLPLIHALNQAPENERKAMLKLIRNKNTDPYTAKAATEMVNRYGGIEYSVKAIERYNAMAIEKLNALPETGATESLKLLLQYNLERKK